MPALFEAYVTNLGKYNEGELAGEYLKFPTTPEEVQALLKRIGVDGVRYEEIFITGFNGDVLGLYDHLGEYENLDELNYLAVLLSEMDQSDIEKFEAIIDSGEHTSSVADLINLTQNLDCFEFYSDVHSDEELGHMYVLEFGGVEVPEHLIEYIDYEAYGRDVRINESGHFAPGGYVFDNGSRFIEHYSGREDIPDEHKVFSMPKLNIREQMAAYKDMLGGLDYPTSGSVTVDGQKLFSLKEDDLTVFRRRKIGFVFQNYNLVPVLNVYENIVLPIQLDGKNPDADYIGNIVETLGLGSKLKNLASNLSGGQQQRVAIDRIKPLA